jgi:hypothetical protein
VLDSVGSGRYQNETWGHAFPVLELNVGSEEENSVEEIKNTRGPGRPRMERDMMGLYMVSEKNRDQKCTRIKRLGRIEFPRANVDRIGYPFLAGNAMSGREF